jgi:hypothetical protein
MQLNVMVSGIDCVRIKIRAYPPKLVGTVADPTITQDQNFFFDLTGRSAASGGVHMKLQLVGVCPTEQIAVENRSHNLY